MMLITVTMMLMSVKILILMITIGTNFATEHCLQL